VTDEQFGGLCNLYGFAPSRSLRELLETATAQAVISEREACLAIAEKYGMGKDIIAAAVRARGQA